MYWYDFRSIIDPTTPAEPLLLGSEGFKSSDVTTFSSLELKFCIVVRELCKQTDIEGLQKNGNLSTNQIDETNINSSPPQSILDTLSIAREY